MHLTEISDISAPELDIFARLSEGELLHYYEPDGGIFIAESALVAGRALDAGCVPLALLVERRLAEGSCRELIERCGSIPVYTAELSVLRQLTGYALTRGVLAAMRRPPLLTPEAVCTGARRIVVLEDVENPTNVGAIFRSAAALGVDGVLLTHGCSDPLYRRAVRVSMGTVFQLPWTSFGRGVWPQEGMELLRKLGFRTAAMALREDSLPLDAPVLKAEEKLALVLGTEGEGLKADTIAACDYTVRIPMSHGVDSLNVAAASAVAFWELRADIL